jgi:hypothetical protein
VANFSCVVGVMAKELVVVLTVEGFLVVRVFVGVGIVH